ncbi:Vacuolar iron transporter 1 [Diplonema papillatum]|nr:Vacuolar iron transporter 1 [Diplonema papillatum]
MNEHDRLVRSGSSHRHGLAASQSSRRGMVVFDDDHIDMDGSFKAAVFGFNDGLTSNTCLMIGIASASHINPTAVLASGLVGLCSGAASMAAGEWISLTLQNRAEEGEIEKEKQHIRQYQAMEEQNLSQLLADYGLSEPTISSISEDLRKAGIDALTKFHAKMELGLDVDGAKGNPVKSMLFMAAAFSAGAVVPLFPWLPLWYPGPHVALFLSVALSLFVTLMVGFSMSTFTCEPGYKTALRQVFAAALATGGVWIVGLIYGLLGGNPDEAFG